MPGAQVTSVPESGEIVASGRGEIPAAALMDAEENLKRAIERAAP